MCKRKIFIYVFIFSIIPSYAQILNMTDSISINKVYMETRCDTVIYKYTRFDITNRSSEIYFSWVSTDSLWQNNIEKEINQHFYTRHGDCSLHDLMHQSYISVINSNNIFPLYSLLIKILPNNNFSFIIDLNKDFNYKNIVLIPQSILCKFVHIPTYNSSHYIFPYKEYIVK